MILRPDFYSTDNSDPIALRKELGLRPDLTTAIVLFGGHGSKGNVRHRQPPRRCQCPSPAHPDFGRNQELAAKFAAHPCACR